MGSTLAQPGTSDGSTVAMQREPLVTFLEMAADSLGVSHRRDEGVLHMEYNPQQHTKWPRPHRLNVPVDSSTLGRLQRGDSSPQEAWQWLWERARLSHSLLVARPGRQPEAVHELTYRLFAPYTVDGGQVQLAGCHLVDIPFLRLTRLAADDPSQVEHQLVNLDGSPVDPQLVQQLGLEQLLPLKAPTSLTSDRSVLECTNQLVAQNASRSGDDLLGITVVAAKRAEGKLQFNLGNQQVSVEFDDWATTLQAPPYHCPLTGIDTYHLTTTHDGRVVAAEGLEACQISGKRMLASELVTCSVTGRRVDPELTRKCPVSGEPALASEFATCSLCQQEVSRVVLDATLCKACRSRTKVSRDQKEVAEVLAQFPRLARYRRYCSSITDEVTILEAAGIWKSLLVVVGRADGKLRAVAARTPTSPWRQVPAEEWPAVVGN